MSFPSDEDTDKILGRLKGRFWIDGHRLDTLEGELKVLRHWLYVRLVAAMFLCVVLSLATAHWIWHLHP